MISIIIPAYNEEKRLPKTLASIISFLNKEKIEAEILIVNDGSQDQTKKVAQEIAKDNSFLKVISYEKNKGKGGAVKEGIIQAKGDYLIFLDADNSTPIFEIIPLLTNLSKGYDLVIGSRRIKGAKILKKQPFLRQILSQGFNFFIKVILGLADYKDTQCGFKGFRKEAGKNIFAKAKINGFAFDTELLCIANLLDYKVLEMPIAWQDEKQSTLRIKSIWNIFWDSLKIKRNIFRGDYGTKKIIDAGFYKDLFWALVLTEISGFFIFKVLKIFFVFHRPEIFLLLILPFLTATIMFLARVLSRRIYEFIKFLIVGILNTALDFLVLNYLTAYFNIFSGPLMIVFNSFSFGVAVINSYFLNKFWTFQSSGKKLSPELFLFFSVSLGANLINTVIVFWGTTFFSYFGGGYFWLNIVKVLAIIFSTFINFLGYKFVVFKK